MHEFGTESLDSPLHSRHVHRAFSTRWLAILTLGSLVAMLVGWETWQWKGSSPDRLTIRDEHGQTRIELGMFQSGAAINMYDAKGRPRLQLGVGQHLAGEISFIDLIDPAGEHRVRLLLTSDASAALESCGLVFKGPSETRAYIGCSNGRDSVVTLNGGLDNPAELALRVGTDLGPEIRAIEDSGKPLFKLGVDKEKTASLALRNAQGELSRQPP